MGGTIPTVWLNRPRRIERQRTPVCAIDAAWTATAKREDCAAGCGLPNDRPRSAPHRQGVTKTGQTDRDVADGEEDEERHADHYERAVEAQRDAKDHQRGETQLDRSAGKSSLALFAQNWIGLAVISTGELGSANEWTLNTQKGFKGCLGVEYIHANANRHERG